MDGLTLHCCTQQGTTFVSPTRTFRSSTPFRTLLQISAPATRRLTVAACALPVARKRGRPRVTRSPDSQPDLAAPCTSATSTGPDSVVDGRSEPAPAAADAGTDLKVASEVHDPNGLRPSSPASVPPSALAAVAAAAAAAAPRQRRRSSAAKGAAQGGSAARSRRKAASPTSSPPPGGTPTTAGAAGGAAAAATSATAAQGDTAASSDNPHPASSGASSSSSSNNSPRDQAEAAAQPSSSPLPSSPDAAASTCAPGAGSKQRGRRGRPRLAVATQAATTSAATCENGDRAPLAEAVDAGADAVKAAAGANPAADAAKEAADTAKAAADAVKEAAEAKAAADLQEVIAFLRKELADGQRKKKNHWEPSKAQQGMLAGLDPRVARERMQQLQQCLPQRLLVQLLRARPELLAAQGPCEAVSRLIALGDALGLSVVEAMEFAIAKPSLLDKDPTDLGRRVCELVQVATERLHAKEPRALILAVLKARPALFNQPTVGEMVEIMSIIAEHWKACNGAKLLHGMRYPVNRAAGSMAAWLQAGLAQALRLKYMDHLRLTAPGAIDDAKKKAHHPMFALQQDPILWRGCISEHFPEFDMWLEGQLAEWQARSSGSGSSSGQLQ